MPLTRPWVWNQEGSMKNKCLIIPQLLYLYKIQLFLSSIRIIWQLIKTILKANYSTVRKQEIRMSEHKDISMQNVLQVSVTDDFCLFVILVSLIWSTSSKRKKSTSICLLFEIKIFKWIIFPKITEVAMWGNFML